MVEEQRGAGHDWEVMLRKCWDDLRIALAVALAGMWRNRCVSRIWQEAGINVFVDLFVSGSSGHGQTLPTPQ